MPHRWGFDGVKGIADAGVELAQESRLDDRSGHGVTARSQLAYLGGTRAPQQNESARRVAEAMERHPKVSRVFYPGLVDFPGHALAKKRMYGFGGMLSIEVAGSGEVATCVADQLKLFALAPSLGGAESLVTQPCTTTHHGLTAEERARRGISDAMLRLSVGLEDADDLIADLEQALG